MPGLTGLEVVRSIPPKVPLLLVIFATGYDQHALSAFEVNALAYLLKPVEADRLAQALERARRLNAFSEGKEAERRNLPRAAGQGPATLKRVVCRARRDVLVNLTARLRPFQFN